MLGHLVKTAGAMAPLAGTVILLGQSVPNAGDHRLATGTIAPETTNSSWLHRDPSGA